MVTAALAKSASFTKGLTVFGISLLATSGVSDAKLLHAANVTAELLDNDENGTVDNLWVVAKLKIFEGNVRGTPEMGVAPLKNVFFFMYVQTTSNNNLLFLISQRV